jgi:hypothetical protein
MTSPYSFLAFFYEISLGLYLNIDNVSCNDFYNNLSLLFGPDTKKITTR